MDDKVKYWLELSEYDFETALAMLESKRYLYVGFMCHQTVEKILKAYFCSKKSESSPYTHSLSYLAKKGEIYHELPEELQDFIDNLEPLNIEARYPSHKERLLKSLSHEKCKGLIQQTKSLQQWIKRRL